MYVMPGIFDPTGAPAAVGETALAPRLESLAGRRVALLDNGKRNASRYLDHLGRRLVDDYGVAATVVGVKPSVSAPYPREQFVELLEDVDAFVTAVGDCGSCSAGSVVDAAIAEELGTPAVAICTDQFRSGAETVARLRDLPARSVVLIDHPVGNLPDEQLEARASTSVAAVVDVLTGPTH